MNRKPKTPRLDKKRQKNKRDIHKIKTIKT